MTVPNDTGYRGSEKNFDGIRKMPQNENITYIVFVATEAANTENNK